MQRIIGDAVDDWKYLDDRIEQVTDEIEALARTDVNCGQLMSVPGIGPIIASAMVAAIGNGAAFAKRARLCRVALPGAETNVDWKDRTILGRITPAETAICVCSSSKAPAPFCSRAKSWEKHSFGPWLIAAARRLHRNILTIALANKLARIALSVLIQGRSYETRIVSALRN